MLKLNNTIKHEKIILKTHYHFLRLLYIDISTYSFKDATLPSIHFVSASFGLKIRGLFK